MGTYTIQLLMQSQVYTYLHSPKLLNLNANRRAGSRLYSIQGNIRRGMQIMGSWGCRLQQYANFFPESCVYWSPLSLQESRWAHIQNTAAKKTLKLGTIKMATLNLFQSVSKQLKETLSVPVEDTHKQLDMVEHLSLFAHLKEQKPHLPAHGARNCALSL